MVLSACFDMSIRLMLEILFYLIYHPLWLIFLGLLFLMGSRTLKVLAIVGPITVFIGLFIPLILKNIFGVISLLLVPFGWLTKLLFGVALAGIGSVELTILLFNIAFILGALIFVMVLNARTSFLLKYLAAIPVTIIFLAIIMGLLGLASPIKYLAFFQFASKISLFLGIILSGGLFPFLYLMLKNETATTFFLFTLSMLFLIYVFFMGDSFSLCSIGNNILQTYTASKFTEGSFLGNLF